MTSEPISQLTAPYAPTARDLDKFRRWHTNNVGGLVGKLTAIVNVIAIPALVIGAFVVGGPALRVTAALVLASWVTWSIATELGHRRAQRRSAALLGGTLTVDATCLRLRCANGEFAYGWEFFEAVVDRPDAVYLLSTPESGVVVPKRLFGTPEAVQEFVGLAQTLHASNVRRSKGATD